MLLKIENLTAGYEKDKPVLNNFSLEIGNNESIGVVGQNAGKIAERHATVGHGFLHDFAGVVPLQIEHFLFHPVIGHGAQIPAAIVAHGRCTDPVTPAVTGDQQAPGAIT